MGLRRLVQTRVDLGDKAPITEALVDIQVVGPEDVGLPELRRFNEGSEARWPKVHTQLQWANQLHLEGATNTSTLTSKHGVRGFVFLSEDGKEVVQVRRDGFTFSRLHPYTSWADLRAGASEAWSRYRELARPSAVRRIGLRYINRLHLPAGPLELQEWFRLQPSTPDELGPLSDLLLRVVLRHPDDARYAALVTLGTAPPEADNASAFLLDVDTWVEQELPSDDGLWSTLDDLREFKNDVFFGSLTPTTLDRLQQ